MEYYMATKSKGAPKKPGKAPMKPGKAKGC